MAYYHEFERTGGSEAEANQHRETSIPKPHTKDFHPTRRVGQQQPFFLSWSPWANDEAYLSRSVGSINGRVQRHVDQVKIVRPNSPAATHPSYVQIGCTYVHVSLLTELYWSSGIAPRWLQWLHDIFVSKEGSK